jgi:hypothetical protein
VDAVDVETELKKLGGWVPGDVAWVNKALGSCSSPAPRCLSNIDRHFTGRPPDAVNVWIGNERSATSAHSGKCYFFRTHSDAHGCRSV